VSCLSPSIGHSIWLPERRLIWATDLCTATAETQTELGAECGGGGRGAGLHGRGHLQWPAPDARGTSFILRRRVRRVRRIAWLIVIVRIINDFNNLKRFV